MKKRNVVALGLAILMASNMMTGCKSDTPLIGGLVGLESDQIFAVDEVICSDVEYKLVLMDTQNAYKEELGQISDWSVEVDQGVTLEDFIKEKVKEDITVKYALAAMAAEKGIVLSTDEQSKVIEAASTYYSGLNESEKKYLGVEQSDVEAVYANYLLAKKVYEKITEPIGTSVTDEEARVITIQYIRLSTDNKKESKINNILQDVTSLVNGGYQQFSREAKQYSEDTTIERVLKKNEVTAPYEIAAFELVDGEISSIIQDGTNYYLVYCVSSYMKDETANNKNSIINKQKKEYFNEQYSSYLEEAETDFNTKAWKKIELTTDENVKNASLMVEFEKIVSEE